MKILLVNKDCQVAGTEMWMAALATRLNAHGHQCELFFFERGPMERHLPPNSRAHFGDLADCLKLVNSCGFDVVHGNSGDWHSGLSAVRGGGARLVLTAHGWVISSWNSTNCDGFVCCSQWQAAEQALYTDLPIRTVLNGIDIEKFAPAAATAPTAPPIIAWVGRTLALKQKRIDKLAAIAPALRRANVRLWIAGPHGFDDLEEVLPEAARTLRTHAEFWGIVPGEQMPQFYREVAASGGCVLSTASFEGLPLALAEAQACGCPVISSDVRGANEVVNPAAGGVLYPFDTAPEQLANIVLDTLRDTERMPWRRAAGVRRMREQFNLERMTQNYLQFYQEVLNCQRKSSSRRDGYLLATALLPWGTYTERRWSAGHCQYEASRKLAQQGEGRLARATAWHSLATCPTLYARPTRLAHLFKTLLPGNAPAGKANGR